MARGVSTVLDVAVCLLLIGAALATLSAAPPASTDPGPTADETADVVATATTGIPVRGVTRHATFAAHLGRAAVSAATLGDRRFLATTYPRSVRNATAEAVPHRTYVTATWRPFTNASVGGRLAAGREPPASADVAAATLTVESGIDAPATGEDPSFESVADGLATAVLDWLFPPHRTRTALLDPRTAPAIADRYRAVGATVGVDVRPALRDADIESTNAALAAALADRLEADLRAEYDSPAEAADATSPETTTVTIRRWRP
jgi:hypothetical protein